MQSSVINDPRRRKFVNCPSSSVSLEQQKSNNEDSQIYEKLSSSNQETVSMSDEEVEGLKGDPATKMIEPEEKEPIVSSAIEEELDTIVEFLNAST